jgi:hypothetical protein
LFHVVASGRCWVSRPDGERYWASAGEVIVLPYGDEFLMGGVEAATPVHITRVVPLPPWTEMPVVRHGGGGDRTDVVCGFLYSEDPLFDPGLAAFPPAFVVRPPEGPAKSWFDASIAYALVEITIHDVPAAEPTLHARYGAHAPRVWLIRPDGHLAYSGAPEDIDGLRTYLDRIYIRQAPASDHKDRRPELS